MLLLSSRDSATPQVLLMVVLLYFSVESATSRVLFSLWWLSLCSMHFVSRQQEVSSQLFYEWVLCSALHFLRWKRSSEMRTVQHHPRWQRRVCHGQLLLTAGAAARVDARVDKALWWIRIPTTYSSPLPFGTEVCRRSDLGQGIGEFSFSLNVHISKFLPRNFIFFSRMQIGTFIELRRGMSKLLSPVHF